MNETQATDLLKRFRSGECTDGEKQLVEAWYNELMNTGELEWEAGEKESIQNTSENWLLQNMTDEEQPYAPVYRMRTAAKAWWAAAAILVIMTGATYYLYNKQQAALAAKKKETLKNDVAPGSNKAVLTLANGTTIVLDDASNGVVAEEGSAKVIKPEDGQLLYEQEDNSKHGPLSYNTLATPRSGQYQVILPDGSKVWLNSESSIHYPVAFAENERRVQITGEAYFEVAKLKNSSGQRIPFFVELPLTGGQVEVLGTHFNVNAYSDESAIKTTLLEGRVRVSQSAISNRQSAKAIEYAVVLKPGEQALVAAGRGKTNRSENDKIKVNKADVDNVVAWKNGLFHFESADIKTVMRQLARWYDVDVVYEGTTVKNDPLFVEVSRNTRLSDVLKVLQESGSAKFTIQGKKIIVK
jgi:ferric-dicitrate binding protein FerR (iron transport regulator)